MYEVVVDPWAVDYLELTRQIKTWGRELGFQAVGIADTNLHLTERRLTEWLAKGFQGELVYIGKHGHKRTRPTELVPGTTRVICARMDYQPAGDEPAPVLADSTKAFVSRYALGRDYHKVLRGRLRRLALRIEEKVGPFGYRVFVDSAPVMEKPLAVKAGLGWLGKHTNLLSREAGSWFFLGELYTDLPLPLDRATTQHCGRCTACIDSCPTRAIVAPYQLDTRLCISYLTIELAGSIPETLRPKIGNRIYGCDDCQLVCPWNRFARPTPEVDFLPRHNLDTATLIELFGWGEAEFRERTAGSAIRRIGWERWLRNIAVALGNVPTNETTVSALKTRLGHPSPLVREHVAWALARRQVPVKPR